MPGDGDDTDPIEWESVGDGGNDAPGGDGPEFSGADFGAETTPEPLRSIEGRTPAEVSPVEVAEALNTDGVDAADVEAALDLSEVEGRPLTGGDGATGDTGTEPSTPGADTGSATSVETDAEDEVDLDSDATTYGYYAGAVVTVATLVAGFVGPWRVYDLTFSGSYVPIESANPPEGVLTGVLVGLPALSLVTGMVAAMAYRSEYSDPEEEYKTDITIGTVLVPIGAGFAGYLLLMFTAAGGMALGGEVLNGLILAVIAVVVVWFFSFFEFLGALIYLGIPSYVGVYVGSLVGSLVDG